jgi:TonB family protein
LPLDNYEFNPAAELIHTVKMAEPRYPESLKDKRIQGSVRLAAVIGVDGSLTVEKVLYSADPAFTASTEAAVRQWKYEPYLLNGKPVAVHIQVFIHYQIRI